MSIRAYRPMTPAQRQKTTEDYDQITTNKPMKSLLAAKKQQAGKNNSGRITVRHRGGGVKRHYRIITYKLPANLTFTVEDALLSPMGFAILSGAGLFKGTTELKKVHVHATTTTTIDSDGKISLKDALAESEHVIREILVPPGCAHGYLVVEDSIVSYKCAEKFYAKGLSFQTYCPNGRLHTGKWQKEIRQAPLLGA